MRADVFSLLLKGCLLLMLLNSTAAAQTKSAASKKYNVLFIASDDLRPELGSYGNKLIKTPNLDRLAARATRFNRAYAQFPLCNPSRTSLLTGRYPTQTGVMDNNTYFRRLHPDWITLPQYFKNNGYAALRTGKIFHGGIDDQISWTEGGEAVNPQIVNRAASKTASGAPPDADDAAESTTAAQTANNGGKASQSDRIIVLKNDGESHGDYKSASRAIEYLEKYRNQPFFLAVGFVKPHSPPTAPQKFFDLYDLSKIPLPPDFAEKPSAPQGFPEISVPKRNTDLFIGRDASPAQAREMIRAYYASTSFMDAQVGRVLDALDRLGLRDNTIVVFWGDHGYHLGEKGKWSKAYSLYEIGVRTPLLIAMPNNRAAVSEKTVQLLDLYPTLTEMCGLPRPAGIAGHSLKPLLAKPDSIWSYPAYSVTMYQGRFGKSVRFNDWHYVEWDDGRAGQMLFNLTADPNELNNLADDKKYSTAKQQLKPLFRNLPDSR